MERMNSNELTKDQLKQLNWDPQLNQNVITIMRQDDGNYRGFTQKNGKFIQTRQSDPGVVMQMLITHDGR